MKRYLLLAFVSGLVLTASSLLRAQQNPSVAPAQRDRTVTKTQPQEPQADVIRVETNLVNTLFTAVDKDRHFVTTLKAEDIRIFENDVPQTISVF